MVHKHWRSKNILYLNTIYIHKLIQNVPKTYPECILKRTDFCFAYGVIRFDLHTVNQKSSRRNIFKLPFLKYLTGESGMIVELFSHRSFIKILFCRVTIWVSRFRITEHFIGNFQKFSGKFLQLDSWTICVTMITFS